MSRVLRFQRALAAARSARAPSWAELAVACGYFDQSHLINEARELTGMSPTELLATRAEAKEHHLALEAGGQKLPRSHRRTGTT